VRSATLPVTAVLLFAAVYLSGDLVSRRVVEDPTAGIVASEGLGRLGAVLGDLLWLQLDDYHHITMYQGYDWTTDRTYLQQLWLISRLNPGFPETYLTGGNHVAVNLGAPEEGLDLLRRGLENCPGDDRIVWEYAIVLWRTGHEGPRSTMEAVWDYMDLVRRRRMDVQEPWNYANCHILLKTVLLEDTLRRNSRFLSDRYQSRSEFLRDLGRVALWPE